jgi:hypothetical protein
MRSFDSLRRKTKALSTLAEVVGLALIAVGLGVLALWLGLVAGGAALVLVGYASSAPPPRAPGAE